MHLWKRTSIAILAALLLPLSPLSAGRAEAAQGNVLTAPIPGRSSSLATYNRALTATEVDQHYRVSADHRQQSDL